MRFTAFITTVTMLCGLSSTVIAGDQPTGHSVNAIGRWLGYGWSRGYHAQDGCQNCLDNTLFYSGEQTFTPTQQPVYHAPPVQEQGYPLLRPAENLPDQPAPKPLPKSVLPTPKTTPPTVEGPKADDARYWQRPTHSLRANRYPLQSYPR